MTPKAPSPRTLGRQRSSLSILFILSILSPCFAQKQQERPPPLNPIQAEKEARALVADLLSQRPAENSTNAGLLRIRGANGQERELPVHFEIVCRGTNWQSVYEAATGDGVKAARLTVVHSDGQPNQYELAEPSAPGAAQLAPRSLSANGTMIPFAGSDFWVADLGLEFLRWPKQRLLKKEMRRSKSCDVLESVNPQPAAGGYARVVSWVTMDEPHGIVHADAYDAKGELLKQFDPTELKKVHGERQLAEMEMRNRQTGSHTWIKFDLEQ